MGNLRLPAALAGFLIIVFASSCSSAPPISVQLSAAKTVIDEGQSVTITATVSNDSSFAGVSWSLSGLGSLTNQSSFSVTYAAPQPGVGAQSATVTATWGADKTASVSITVNPPPSITTASLPGGSAGTAYSQTVAESGGTPPFEWSISYGALPNGLSLSASTGTIGGTPTEGGTWYFWTQLTDAAGVAVVWPFLSIEVLPNTAAGNPVPFLDQPLMPDAIAPGGPQFTLTAKGTGFLPASTVDFNGTALATTFVSDKQLSAVVPAADIATASTASITVVNPSPGGGKSNAVYFPISTTQADVTFSSAKGSPISVQSSTYITVGDFRGQGKPDLVFTINGYGVGTLLANGDGTFTAGTPLVVPRPPWNTYVDAELAFITVGDFNNSGNLGLVLANGGDNSAPILLGNGDGTFTIPTSFVSSGGEASAVAVGDFLGNGNLDLAVGNGFGGVPGSIDIVLGCGDGAFNQGPVSANVAAYMPVIGDFNGDGNLDIATGGAVLLGNGDGTFSLTPNSTGSGAMAIVAADFNGDGKLDLAVASYFGGSVAILLGNGDGTFTPASGSPITVGTNPVALSVGDFNSDGKIDLVVANQTDNTLSILLGNGDGTFTPAASSPLALGTVPFSVAVGDFNSSGRLGLAITSGDQVVILVQQP